MQKVSEIRVVFKDLYFVCRTTETLAAAGRQKSLLSAGGVIKSLRNSARVRVCE